MKKRTTGEMPDIASHSSSVINSKINWVGMDDITLPITFCGESVLAKANIYVNVLDPSAKGIHMSRLFLALGSKFLKKDLTLELLTSAMNELVDSQQGLSNAAQLVLKWQQPLSRRALISDNRGWKTYPMRLKLVCVDGKQSLSLGFSTHYSSTCPCSAALARQLVQKEFKNHFTDQLDFDEVYNWLGQNQIASPHSQRSRADVQLVFEPGEANLDVIKYIDLIEGALRTPVQTAVKREDEQEFARLNGENLMFVEDALRRMKESLEPCKELKNFRIKAHHFESLHQHDAVGVISKS